MNQLILFVACFARVFLRALQQRNVMCLNYKLVPPTSLLMTVTEVYVWGVIVVSILEAVQSGDFWNMAPIVVIMAVGSALGCISAMYLHKRYIK